MNLNDILSFDTLKAKYQKWKMDTMYYWYLLSCDIGIFEYDNLPESIDPIYLELFLNRTGAVGIKKKDGLYIVGDVSRDGELNQYGLGEQCIGVAINGDDFTGTVGKDCIIIYNNPLKTPEIDLLIDAVSMSDCQQSAGINVRFARIAPVFKTNNSVKKAQIDNMMQEILSGTMQSYITDTKYDNDIFGAEMVSDLETVDVTQPERIQYVQYLSRYQDDIMRRHFSRRGLSMRTPTKAAQQSDSEINGMDSVSWYYVLQKLSERKKGFDNFNTVNGESVTVRLSEIWQNEYDAYIIRTMKKDAEQENEMGVNDNAESPAESDN